MRDNRTDEIINNILQLRLDVVKLDLKVDQMFQSVINTKSEATEKQIPKKVIKQKEELTDEEDEELVDLGFCDGDIARCPNCNKFIAVDKLKYCMECGQRLGWD